VPIELTAFQPLADLLPEPMLIVQSNGTIVAVNRAFTASFGWRTDQAVDHNLADLVSSPAEELAGFLRHCSATSGFLFGALTLRHSESDELPCRAEGAALRFGASPTERLVLLRLLRKESAVARFVDLTHQLEELSVEVGRRRRAERAAADALECERAVRDRLTSLAEASGALVASLALSDVLPAIGKLAVQLVPADAHAVWHCAPGGRNWRTVWQQGLSESFVTAVDDWNGYGGAAAPIDEPLYVADIEHVPLLVERRRTCAEEGIRSLIVIPLRINGTTCGTAVAYYRRQITFTGDDRCVATALCNLASSALSTTMLYEAESASRRAAQLAGSRSAFLARASSVLSSSLDYEATLRTLAQLAVPEIADWCAVDIATDANDLKRLAVAHVNPEKVQIAWQLHERYPADPQSPYGAAHVLRTGQPVIMSRISEELIAASARDAEHLAVIRSLGLTSYMCVPLVARGQALGVLTFVAADSGREYTESDLRFAEEVAARAALAVENSRAYEEARRANRVKDEFLATLSHELRTPLNAVLGYARMVRSDLLEPSKRTRALEILERNAVSLNQIVEDILDVSRIVAGKIRLNVQPLDLSLVLRDAAATVRPAADAKGVHLSTDLDPQAAFVSGDHDRLQQVAWNLLSNAVKFTARNGRVHLRLDQVGSHVRIVVSDTGAGISRDFLPHLFEPFRQGDSGFAREHGGLGLGLAISRHIVEMHGGRIDATSEGEGRGAVFTVRLPVMAVQRPSDAEIRRISANTADALPPPTLAGQLDGIHVLVVDDDPDARSLISDILQASGAHVTTADSAQAALRLLAAEGTPQVLLTDIGMPGMDGLELIMRIRQSPRAEVRQLAAIALTAYARSEDRVRALETGCQMHLAKPISPEELVAAIRDLATRERTA